MPPEIQQTPLAPRDLLATMGILEKRPHIRSSDFRGISSPFHYYLTRKLGLVKALRWSSALSKGSWFHTAIQLVLAWENNLSPDSDKLVFARAKYQEKLELRMEELKAICKSLAMGDEIAREILSREELDADTAWAWATTAAYLPIQSKLTNNQSIDGFLNSSNMMPLCEEESLLTTLPWHDEEESPPCIAQVDRLAYHKSQSQVWIIDYKTTAISPRIRAASCPIEFQTQHYMAVVNRMIDMGTLQAKFDLPSKISLGGMIHVIVQKPTITFGMNDRDHTLDISPFKSGPRKGQPRNEKIYQGEPRIENYVERCKHWYKATDDYLHRAAEDPPINLSFTSGTAVLNADWNKQYRARLHEINRWRLADIDPIEYPWPSEIHGHGKLDDYAPFVLRPVGEWGDIIVQEGFTIMNRDATLLDADGEQI